MALNWIQLNQQSIGSGGGLVTFPDFDDIRDPMLGLSIIEQGANVTDEATTAELLAGLGTFAIKRGGSNIISWDADDLLYHNIIHRGRTTPKLGGTADNNIRMMNLWLPFGFTRPWDRVYDMERGLCRMDKGLALEFTTGNDTAAGADARTLDVAALVEDGGADRDSFLGHILRNYTAAAATWKDIDLGVGDEELAEIFGFQTTNIDDGVTATTTTVEEIRLLRSKKEDVIRSIKTEMFLPYMVDADIADEYFYVPVEPPLLLDVPTDVSLLGGDAQAVRVYPGILYKNAV